MIFAPMVSYLVVFVPHSFLLSFGMLCFILIFTCSIFLFFFFFFSSRRRHTRCLSDWSSDVCSSDLNGPTAITCTGKSFLMASSFLFELCERLRIGVDLRLAVSVIIPQPGRFIQDRKSVV